MESGKNNTIVIIPSYNEARTIGGIVLDIVRMGLSVLVIDDGSTDNTERAALDNGALVLRNRKNIGKGFSVREGVKYVILKTNFEWVVIMDGDGQHHTEDIPGLMKATEQEVKPDIVIGNRMLETKTMPSIRYITNKFMSWLISGICRQYIPDTQCGYRLINVNALKKLKLTSKKYDIESETLILAAEMKMKITSVPIQTIYGAEVSKIKPIRDMAKFCMLIYRHHFKRKP
ncbi:MAG: glycosyltransferase family 2 protein [Candidatus Omnitrophica bacterium]|nr:glycosyltransferase family 2 protein [Candidatus Omnitrophota bacterium]